MNIQQLKHDYEAACNAYVTVLCMQWQSDRYYSRWISDEVGGVLDFYDGALFLNMEDIIYIVENDLSMKEVYEWQEYNVKVAEYNLNTINLKSWHMGAPRVSQETLDKLDEQKKALNDEIERIKEEMV